jgi:hypothetical protein
MGLRDLLDSILPVDTPEEVKKKMVEYGRKNPDLSESQILDKFSGSMSRAKKAAAKKALKDMPLPKSKPTKAERKKAADDAKAEALMTSLEKRASKEISAEREKLGLKNNKGGYIKKTQMAYGGMAGGKKHMYAAGGSVTENPGLKALKKASPQAYNKITSK